MRACADVGRNVQVSILHQTYLHGWEQIYLLVKKRSNDMPTGVTKHCKESDLLIAAPFAGATKELSVNFPYQTQKYFQNNGK